MKGIFTQKALFKSLFFLVFFQSGIAQNITGKITDSKTGEIIPYANIQVNSSESIISNAEGYFTLAEKNSSDETLLIISYLGYVPLQISVADLKKVQNNIKLTQGIVELDDVDISNEKPDAAKIMAKVKENLNKNYKNTQAKKDLIFVRHSSSFNPKKFDFEIDKSTVLSAKALKKTNDELNTFTKLLIAHPPQQFTDYLCNYYTIDTKKEDKPTVLSKLEVLKATILKNENRSASLDDLEKKFTDIILHNLDTTKYYRVKSGLFGSHDTISLGNKKKGKEKKKQLNSSKAYLDNYIRRNNIIDAKRLNFINKPEMYDYSYEGATYSSENKFVYVISFKPRKSKAKYSGKIYVSEDDYAVLRTDYTLEEGEKEASFNMKLLLGVKFSVNQSKGTLIYKENPIGEGYCMQYASLETGQYFYFNRPIKFIELAKGEKDVVKFDLKIEGSSKDKNEFMNIKREETSKATIENFKEEDFKFINIKKYDPTIWKNYSAIEPLQEMKQFKEVN
ncbi:carboxypeptidase-like regulatory domain-containing protein [Flavobacterium agrisoli]|uniref:Carboxypeptidase-like regulatory domain-containing protein n=1 Tax=Flavobacterium agrisoli TaxID=2793066 RepID=A0A934UJK0_9FLAO|nr:carboxypeptidase-like regulatory domain-containing protein [Flavobacterium agrisoli]MBK0369977.1 carboxypeptidase-like regulatory domain-containing protein [Flavobacterium agrisoli]